MYYPSRFILIVLFFTLLSGCLSKYHKDDPWVGDGQWVKKIDGPEIVHALQHFLPYLRHAKHLRLEDSKVYYDDTINAIHMEFLSQDVLEIREARMILVDLVEGLLAELNRNPILGAEFIQYPLNEGNLEIYINFESFHGLFVDPYYVSYIKLEDGEAKFYAFDNKYNGVNLWDYRIEPYFKSREFVIFERESEKMFKEVVEIETSRPLKEQYFSPDLELPRYYSPYEWNYIFKDDD